jgi:hypothetical protein
MENHSTFNDFSTIGQNIMKPTECTDTHHRLSIAWRVWNEMLWFGKFSMWQTNKTNKTPLISVTFVVGTRLNSLLNEFLFFKTNCCSLVNFQWQKVAQNSISPTRNGFQNYKIISIKSSSLSDFQQLSKVHPNFHKKNIFFDFIKFSVKKIVSIFNNFCIIWRNIMKSPRCTCTHWMPFQWH